MNKNIQGLKSQFKLAVEKMKTNHENVTYYWYLENPVDDNNDWAIVLGWGNGFDDKDEDPYTDGMWRICAKLGIQPNNSLMQCDYDIDWIMPYNKETNEVDDNERCIYPDTDLDEVVDWLIKCYETYKEEK